MPVIWIINPYRAGEQNQVNALAEALGWPVEIKSLEYRPLSVLPHLLGATSVAGISRDSRARLRPPWPDYVISCGVRNEPVCRWIRAQSGGGTRYIHLGRPWGRLDSFDLVITTPQYRIPAADNVVHNTLTLNSVHTLDRQQLHIDPHLAELPRPRIAVLTGGNSGPFTLGPRAAARLAQQASALARQHRGSLLVTTSARTPPAVTAELVGGLTPPHVLYRWQADDPDNLYRQILLLADALIVTGDSIGMLSEACTTGKAVYIFDPGGMRDGAGHAADFRLGAHLYQFMLRWLWAPLSRDITLVHSELVQSGRASWLDDATATGVSDAPGRASNPDMARAVAAVRALDR